VAKRWCEQTSFLVSAFDPAAVVQPSQPHSTRFLALSRHFRSPRSECIWSCCTICATKNAPPSSIWPFTAGLSFQGAYTWSKSIDDEVSNYQGAGASDIFGAINWQSTSRRAERSLSVFDIPHKLNAAFSYQVPFAKNKLYGGWNLFRTVHALELPGQRHCRKQRLVHFLRRRQRARRLHAASGSRSRRPAINPDWRRSPFTEPYLNPAAFVIPGTETAPRLGNSPRMLPDARSPAITSFDASVFKNIRFNRDGRRYAQLRVDVINVPNHANFFINPNSSRTFGAYNFNATTRAFTANNRFQQLDPNNTGQFGNYAGRSFRLGARLYF